MFSVSEVCDPDNLDRQQREADLAPLHAAVQAYMPYAAGPVLKFAACMFIMTPDGHFVIDTHPKHEQVRQTITVLCCALDCNRACATHELVHLSCFHWVLARQSLQCSRCTPNSLH